MNAEGWYLDPYERHAHRWFSDGRPTALVRDRAGEATDEPPNEPYTEPLVPAPEHPADSSDLLRADDAAAEDFDAAAPAQAVFDSFGSSGVGQP